MFKCHVYAVKGKIYVFMTREKSVPHCVSPCVNG